MPVLELGRRGQLCKSSRIAASTSFVLAFICSQIWRFSSNVQDYGEAMQISAAMAVIEALLSPRAQPGARICA